MIGSTWHLESKDLVLIHDSFRVVEETLSGSVHLSQSLTASLQYLSSFPWLLESLEDLTRFGGISKLCSSLDECRIRHGNFTITLALCILSA